MANRHFAALGDVWKHLTLAEVLRLHPPARYWETHAGSATYTMTESPTRLHGAIRFLSRAPGDPDLSRSAYLEALRAMPGMYPGSPALAMRTLGKSARYAFCDTDPESTQSLRTFGSSLDLRVIQEDGIAAIRREAEGYTSSPSDVFVHIDPYDPHERLSPDGMTPVELAASLARRGCRLFYWYGYDTLEQRGWARREISQLAPCVGLWCGDVLIPSPFVYPGRSGAWGCGIVLANMHGAEADTCARLGKALESISTDDLLPGNEPGRLTFSSIEE